MSSNLPFNPDYNVGLVATVQKSGTWYHQFLFGTYDNLLSSGSGEPRVVPGVTAVDSLKLNFGVFHTICPGFRECCEGALRKAWDEIPAITIWSHQLVQDNLHLFSPIENCNVKIVFVYRNPLDQFFSAYRHLQKHVRPDRRALVEGRSLDEFIRDSGLNNYLKMFVSFGYMRERYESNIMFLSYERVMRDRRQAALDALHFLGRYPADARQMDALDRAVAATTRDKIRAVEAANGFPLANDQTDLSETHIRSGESGLWRGHVSEETIDWARSKFGAFGYSFDQIMEDAGQGLS